MARRRMNEVYDIIDRLESPDFSIGLETHGYPSTQPKASDIREQLLKRLRSLDYEQIAAGYQQRGTDALPRWSFQCGEWELVAYPIPKGEQMRGQKGIRPIGMETMTYWENARDALRSTIVRKRGAYCEQDIPYVVAVGVTGDLWPDRVDILDALFGTMRLVIPFGASRGKRAEWSRAGDGVWAGRTRPMNRRISAVLIARALAPWALARAQVCLYHNPWAKRPYELDLTRLSEATVDDGEIRWKEGRSVTEVLGLPSDWPGP